MLGANERAVDGSAGGRSLADALACAWAWLYSLISLLSLTWGASSHISQRFASFNPVTVGASVNAF